MKTVSFHNNHLIQNIFSPAKIRNTRSALTGCGLVPDTLTMDYAALFISCAACLDPEEIHKAFWKKFPTNNKKTISDALAGLLKDWEALKQIEEVRISPDRAIVDAGIYQEKFSTPFFEVFQTDRSYNFSGKFMRKLAFEIIQPSDAAYQIPNGLTDNEAIEYIMKREKN